MGSQANPAACYNNSKDATKLGDNDVDANAMDAVHNKCSVRRIGVKKKGVVHWCHKTAV